MDGRGRRRADNRFGDRDGSPSGAVVLADAPTKTANERRVSLDPATLDARWRLYDLRHWSASVAIAAGYDVKTVADRLGHANAAMTLRVYAHAFVTSDRAVADSVGALREGGRS